MTTDADSGNAEEETIVFMQETDRHEGLGNPCFGRPRVPVDEQ